MKSILVILIFLHNYSNAQQPPLSIAQWGQDRELSGGQDFHTFNYLKVKSIEESTYYRETDSTKLTQEPNLVLEFDTLGRLSTKIYHFNKELGFRGPFTAIPDTSDGTIGKYLFKSADTSITYITSRLVFSYPKENTIIIENLEPKTYPFVGAIDGKFMLKDSLRKETILTKTNSTGSIRELTYFVNDKEVRKEKHIYQLFDNNGNKEKLLIRIECIKGNRDLYEIRFEYAFFD